MRPQFQKSLRCYVVVVATVTLRLEKTTVYLFIFKYHYHYLLTKEMVPAVNGLFVCFFVCFSKIQRAYCLKSLRRICQRQRSQYLSLLCFYVSMFI